MLVGFRGATWRAIAYFVVSLFTSVLWCSVIVTMLTLGAVTLIIGIGLPILVATISVARALGRVDRQLANWLLRANIAPAPELTATSQGKRDPDESWWRHTTRLLADPSGWRHVAWTSLAVVPMSIGFTLAVIAVTLPFAAVGTAATGVFSLFTTPTGWYTDLTAATVETLSWAAIGAGLLLLALTIPAFWAVRGWASLTRDAARWSLGPSHSDELAQATARAERAEAQVRVDQELHDSIGHMITMTVVQAGAASHVFESDPEFARQALKTIEERGRAAMGDLDRIIASIQGTQGGGSAPTAPLPGADAVPALVADARTAGLIIKTTLSLEGEVPAPVGTAVYSTVREALTNAARHAPGATVTLKVSREGEDVRVLVSNPVPKSSSPPGREGGRGLSGIRHRIELLGGTVDCGVKAPAGSRPAVFTVDARIPVGAPVSSGKQA